jgi:type IV secretion system protein VirB5
MLVHIDKTNQNSERCRCETTLIYSLKKCEEQSTYQAVKINKFKWSRAQSRIKLALIFIFSLISFNNTSYALWPVIDITEIAKTLEVIQQLKQQYDTLKEQYDQMKSQYKAITGNYGWGDLGNNLNDLKDRQWSADNWKDALKGLSGGNSQRYTQLWDQYKANHLILSEEDFSKGADANLAKNYSQNLKANQASSVMSDYEFEKINKHLQKAYELGKSIENANKNNDLKSAVDLNSRIELESTFISIEILRMQTLLNQQTSQGGAAALALDQEAARFNKVEEDL